jgi:glycosyltransferase involved in cell wall biosynthesis
MTMSKKILYLITEDWFFESHFLDRAIAASDAGFQIFVATNISNKHRLPSQDKITYIPISFQRSGLNLFHDLITLYQIFNLFRIVSPDIIHQIAIKPVIYGTFVRSAFHFNAKIINAPVGLGYVFTSSSIKAKTLKPIIHLLLKWTLNPKKSKVVFENSDDLIAAINHRSVSEEDAVLIQGAGVDMQKFKPVNNINTIPIVTLVARMLSSKGIIEFIEAAKIINLNGIRAVFNLVGETDPLNPASLNQSYLEEKSGKFGLYWRGFKSNILEVYQESDIACLPSYREGLPKSLIEAAACGLPIVTTNTVGCREVVVHEVNGLLVPVKSAVDLADAIVRLISSRDLRVSMGIESRRLAINKFSSEIVIKETLNLYR